MKKQISSNDAIEFFRTSIQQSEIIVYDEDTFSNICKSVLSLNAVAIKSHSSQVFLLTNSDGDKYVLKIRTIDTKRKLQKIRLECHATSLLKNASVRAGQPIFYSTHEEYELCVFEFIEGKLLSEVRLDLNTIESVWKSIHMTQKIFGSVPANDLFSQIQTKTNSVERLSRQIYARFKIDISDELDDLFSIETTEESSVVVSDRSPANWISDNGNLFAIDFDLVFFGDRYLDFCFFNEDYRLKTKCSRSDLLSEFEKYMTDNHSGFSIDSYLTLSIYHCLLQSTFLQTRQSIETTLDSGAQNSNMLGFSNLAKVAQKLKARTEI
ncbi:aminoglycoside phosphotransferase family protein [Candidatus Pacebacteria bacterium]|nr:aminoglycoside phosphotransferase family protein [Candidatus Paceibacterota bacterium]